MMKSPEEDDPEKLETMNDQLDKAYVAGMIDGNSTITANIWKDDDYRLGYNIECLIQLTRPMPFALQKIDDFCLSMGIMSNISVKEHEGRDDVNGERYVLKIRNEHHIQMFLDQIYPFLRDRREEADLLSSQIIPAIRKGEHLNKESFMEIVRDIDNLRELNPHVTRSKYTEEHFKKEWEL